MRATGSAGTLRVGYQWAADLGAWALAPQDGGLPGSFALSARITRQHDYWIQQAPIDLALTLGRVEWLWRDVVVVRDGECIVIRLAERPIVSERAVVER